MPRRHGPQLRLHRRQQPHRRPQRDLRRRRLPRLRHHLRFGRLPRRRQPGFPGRAGSFRFRDREQTLLPHPRHLRLQAGLRLGRSLRGRRSRLLETLGGPPREEQLLPERELLGTGPLWLRRLQRLPDRERRSSPQRRPLHPRWRRPLLRSRLLGRRRSLPRHRRPRCLQPHRRLRLVWGSLHLRPLRRRRLLLQQRMRPRLCPPPRLKHLRPPRLRARPSLRPRRLQLRLRRRLLPSTQDLRHAA